ncbi:uncharacterized protein [Miscanthus floridulus]|uniref:uncharacterized protein n=1 Tax=Miscanthus floridulus TaxID=154761 RepID=UPI00345A23BE
MAMPAAHFSHPQHELKLRTKYHLPRLCDLCGEKLTGSGYSCHHRLCGFDLHEECAKYPETLSSFFAHPWHDLTLARTDDDGRRVCDLCREEVPAGVFLYHCAPCGFGVHPRCSRLPQTASSNLHPDHSLTALPDVGACAACREPCFVWVYRCGLCNFDLHIECLHGARPSTTTTITAAATTTSSSMEKESSLGKFVGGLALAADVAAVGGLAQSAGESLMNMFQDE